MENNGEVLEEEQIENTYDLEIANSLNEISYKMDALVFRQEEQTGAISHGFAIVIAFLTCLVIYSFIKSFIDF
ncbi:MAG: hypothetical protein IJ867_01670 [Clostridia bacterium]|nr:hypothetical protein [Clostridia bacterium]